MPIFPDNAQLQMYHVGNAARLWSPMGHELLSATNPSTGMAKEFREPQGRMDLGQPGEVLRPVWR
jgi:hypothetical protein